MTTVKNVFIKALTDAEAECNETRKSIWRAYQRYSSEVAKEEIAKIQKNQVAYLDAHKATVEKAVEQKITSMRAFYENDLKKRREDASYQAALANAVQILPVALGTASPEDLREMLKRFDDDPFAIAALKGAVLNNAADKDKAMDSLSNMVVMPVDNRAKQEHTLLKLKDSVIRILDDMQVTVNEPPAWAAQAVSLDDFRTISGAVPIGSTIDYINSCNDDCTEYDRAKHYAMKPEERYLQGQPDFHFRYPPKHNAYNPTQNPTQNNEQ